MSRYVVMSYILVSSPGSLLIVQNSRFRAPFLCSSTEGSNGTVDCLDIGITRITRLCPSLSRSKSSISTMASVDASNSCIPLSSPLSVLSPPLPTTVRGEPCVLDGSPGRLNADSPIILYGSGRLVICRFINDSNKSSFVYRGHQATVTAAKFSPSGAYVASADARGKLRVWSWDNEEHLCKLDLFVLTGPIRSIAWDAESKRVSLFCC